MKNEKVIPINYLLVDDQVHEGKATIYHFLDRSLVYHLRFFMTLMYLPSDSFTLDTKKTVFSAALHRLHTPPLILRAPAKGKLEDQQWSFLRNQLLIILAVNGQIPKWSIELASLQPIGLLTPSEKVLEEAKKEGCFQVGLLKGFKDLIEAYRVIGELIWLCTKCTKKTSEIYPILMKLVQQNLYENRVRLGFIKPIPLPEPHNGRSAAYLLNRLSNNVDKPSLLSKNSEKNKKGFLILPRLLDYSYAACLLLAGKELGIPMPSNTKINKADLDANFSFLMGNAEDDIKLERWMRLGEKITSSKALHSPLLVSVPAARIDLFKHHLPSTVKPEMGFNKKKKAIISKALSDHMKNQVKKNFKNKGEKEEYKKAQETLIMEHRSMAVQTACIGMQGRAIPIQTPEIGGSLYSVARDLNNAFNNRTHKTTKLFRKFEIMLAESFPEDLHSQLVYGSSDIIFYSDLPFEWALLDYWPVCLTRPVSRIPMSATDVWLNLTHSYYSHAEINISRPERVLVLDLIDEKDPIRKFSDQFRQVSESLGQKYRYRKPSSASELKEILAETSPEIVVLDTHGNYQTMSDELLISLGNRSVKLDSFIPDGRVPPVWILSACDMLVTTSLKGSMVVPLLKRGAVCVIATVQKIDALAASIFVGRLLTDIYSPPSKAKYASLSDAFFVSQLTTALLYDPLLPLLRKASPGSELAQKLFNVFGGYIQYFREEAFEPRSMRYKAGEILHENIVKQGLMDKYMQTLQSGEITPETLLFTAFGLPSNVNLIKNGNE